MTLWQQEDSRVLLNAGAPTAPGITAIAVESAAPDVSARRAEALLALVLRFVQPGGTVVLIGIPHTPSAILGPPSDFACVPEAMAGAAKYAGKSWISFS